MSARKSHWWDLMAFAAAVLFLLKLSSWKQGVALGVDPASNPYPRFPRDEINP